MNSAEYVRTDLASESAAGNLRGIFRKEYETEGFPTVETEVTAEGEKTSGIASGTFITLSVGKIWLYDKKTAEKTVIAVSGLLRQLITKLFPDKKASENLSVLTVCLGNRSITSDSVGPLCAEKLIVTRHLRAEKSDLFAFLGGSELSVITPGVTGDTGIETSEIIRAACKTVNPSVVICVDALAARSPERLASSVQLTDTGISPGSGVGNMRNEISRKTLGVPVISIGIPTVVHSSTLVYDALEKAGLPSHPKELEAVLENGKSFFVTPKDADVSVRAMAELTARAINLTFLGMPEL